MPTSRGSPDLHFINIQSSLKLQPRHFMKLENNTLLTGDYSLGTALFTVGHRILQEGMGIASFISHTCHRVAVQPWQVAWKAARHPELLGDSSRALGDCHPLTEECRAMNLNLDCWEQSENSPQATCLFFHCFCCILYIFSTKVMAKIWK